MFTSNWTVFSKSNPPNNNNNTTTTNNVTNNDSGMDSSAMVHSEEERRRINEYSTVASTTASNGDAMKKKPQNNWSEFRLGIAKSLSSGLQQMTEVVQQLGDSIDAALPAPAPSQPSNVSIANRPKDMPSSEKIIPTGQVADDGAMEASENCHTNHGQECSPSSSDGVDGVNHAIKSKPEPVDMFNSSMVEVFADIGKDIATGFRHILKQKPPNFVFSGVSPSSITPTIVDTSAQPLKSSEVDPIVIAPTTATHANRSLLERDILELQEELAANWEDFNTSNDDLLVVDESETGLSNQDNEESQEREDSKQDAVASAVQHDRTSDDNDDCFI